MKKTLKIIAIFFVAVVIIWSLYAFYGRRYIASIGRNTRPGYVAMEVEYTESRPEHAAILAKIGTLNLGHVSVDTIGDNRVVIQTKELSEPEHQRLLAALSDLGKMQETKFNSSPPTEDCPLLIDMSKVSFEIKEGDGNGQAIFTQAYITKGRVETNQFGESVLQFELSGEGKTAFANLTEKASDARERVALFINEKPVSFPVVMEKIITDKIRVNIGSWGKTQSLIGKENLKLDCD